MSIFAICGVAVTTAVVVLMLRNQSSHSAMLLSIGAGVVIFLCVIKNIPETVSGITAMLTNSGVDSSQLVILLKVMGICFVTEFTCDCVTEAGLLSLSTNISFAGKILVLLTALPLFNQIFAVIQTLGGAG